jgi:hypothetical protein
MESQDIRSLIDRVNAQESGANSLCGKKIGSPRLPLARSPIPNPNPSKTCAAGGLVAGVLPNIPKAPRYDEGE